MVRNQEKFCSGGLLLSFSDYGWSGVSGMMMLSLVTIRLRSFSAIALNSSCVLVHSDKPKVGFVKTGVL